MQQTTVQNLRAVASQILAGQYTKETPFCPEVVKRAIDVLEVLKDGDWHTAAQVGADLGLGKRYVHQVIQACSEAWGIERSGRKGVRSTLSFCPQCRTVYCPDSDGWHECDRCGWHWIEECPSD